MIRWLLSKLSPVPKLEMELVKASAPDRPELRRVRFTGDRERHRLRKPARLRRVG